MRSGMVSHPDIDGGAWFLCNDIDAWEAFLRSLRLVARGGSLYAEHDAPGHMRLVPVEAKKEAPRA